MATTVSIFYQITRSERLGPYATLKGAAEVLEITENRLARLIKRLNIRTSRLGWVHAIHREAVEEIHHFLSAELTPG
jgi:N-acyl-L-homoserine lactone synthetase